jgi:hypothetical protein
MGSRLSALGNFLRHGRNRSGVSQHEYESGTLAESRIAETRSREPDAHSFPSPTILRDVHNLMLEDEQIGCARARQPHHILIVIFDPSMDGLSVHELNRNGFLFFSQGFKESGLLERIFRRRRTAALGGIGIPLRSAERHAVIVHKALPTEGGPAGE